ncbi:hypothetical protein GCM10010112_34270 [Actinoplanes lobatus]|uniref:Uncharacterized protein n=1 Tax=Actinoplanes lobatus TaxID=113568 RepID=A0ABQ4ATA5_9ACTN|nr:hypothetical protein GCM10010112_34270 [Actinoplanes lobatus]GIE44213.1 hypothetical protein Alo02nite_71110 [Actinoplanes lobatus]
MGPADESKSAGPVCMTGMTGMTPSGGRHASADIVTWERSQRNAPARRSSTDQLAVQVSAGTLFVPVQDPRNPNDVVPPAATLPL